MSYVQYKQPSTPPICPHTHSHESSTQLGEDFFSLVWNVIPCMECHLVNGVALSYPQDHNKHATCTYNKKGNLSFITWLLRCKQLLWKTPHCEYFSFLTPWFNHCWVLNSEKRHGFPKFIHFTNILVSNIPGVECLGFISLGALPDLTKQPTAGNT